MFVFTQVHNSVNVVDGVQLSEINLFTSDGEVNLIAASNPRGSDTRNQGAMNLIDNNNTTKWYDGNFQVNQNSTVILYINHSAPAQVVQYQLWSADVPRRRDPVSWTFGILGDDGTYHIWSTVQGAESPEARDSPYPTYFSAFNPPSPPLPPSNCC